MKEIYTGKIDIYGHHETRSARSVSELLGGSQDPVKPHYAKDRIVY